MARVRHYLAKKLPRREGSAVRSAHFSASQAALEKSSFLGDQSPKISDIPALCCLGNAQNGYEVHMILLRNAV